MANKFKIDLANAFPNWNDDVGAWATLTGGVVIASHPVAGDAAIADGNSGNIVVNVSSACSSFTATAAYARTMSGTAAMNLTGTGTVWSWSAGTMSYSGTITVSDTTNTNKGFVGGGKTYGDLIVNGGSNSNFSNDDDCVFTNVTISIGIGGSGGQNGLYAGGAVLVVTGALTVLSGAINADGQDMTVGSLISSNSTARTISNIGTLRLTGTGTVLDFSTATNLDIENFASLVVISDTSSSGKTFAGGGQTYNALTITGSAGDVIFTGDNTFAGTFTSGASPLDFYGTTTTFSGTVTLTGCRSITGGNWVKASGTVTAPSGCIITNNHASGGATFTATSAINGGGNTGWTFTHPQPTDGETGLAGVARWWQFGRHVSRYARRIR